jgi:predicted ABC-type ATPase
MSTAVIVSGANGAGKTTFARQFLPLLHPGVPFLNADEIRLESPAFRAPVAASRELLRRLDGAERARQSFAVETTLSSRTYLSRIRRWSAVGYATTIHFIELPSADFAVQRVAARVANGGHDIPEADIRRRFERGLKLFLGVYKSEVPHWYHWSSDDNGLRLIATSSRP